MEMNTLALFIPKTDDQPADKPWMVNDVGPYVCIYKLLNDKVWMLSEAKLHTGRVDWDTSSANITAPRVFGEDLDD